MELIFFLFTENCKLNKDIILESNFHTDDLQRLHQIAAAYDYEVLSLVLRGDVELLHKRYLNRMHQGRHPVHLSTTLDVFEDFKGYTEYARTEEIMGDVLTLCADDFAYQENEEILSKIDIFMWNIRKRCADT